METFKIVSLARMFGIAQQLVTLIKRDIRSQNDYQERFYIAAVCVRANLAEERNA